MIVWCEVLSTEGHQHCTTKGCQCPCHLTRGETLVRRPHGYSRLAWSLMGEVSRRRVVWASRQPRRRA